MAKDHVYISNVAGGHLLTCAHCGQTETVTLPMEWGKWKTVTRRFQKQHRHCPPPADGAAGARPDDALQARLDAAIAALIRLARAHYSYYRRRGGHYRDDAIGRRIFSDYESESDALFRVLEAEGLIRGMDDEEGGYAFVSDLADAATDGRPDEAADQTADTTGRGFLIDSVKGRILTARSRLAQLEWLCGQESAATERLEAAGTLLRKQILEFDRLNDAWRARGERAAE